MIKMRLLTLGCKELTAMMCVYLNWFWAETRRGVRCSGRKPVKAGESASKT